METTRSFKTKLKVDESTVNKTIGCRKNFNCLKNDVQVCCKVENCVNKKVHFVTRVNNTNCSYNISFGNSSICTCAVRKEIFNIYGL